MYTAEEVPCPLHLAWRQSPAFGLLPLQLWRLWGAAMPIQTARLAPKESSAAQGLLKRPVVAVMRIACDQECGKDRVMQTHLGGEAIHHQHHVPRPPSALQACVRLPGLTY